MYCEGSQEQEFMQMIKGGTLLISGDELILETDSQTIYFKKSE
jgi:heat shock protein HslJ